MGMPWKGCSSSRCISPETMQEALADTASSRNLLSFGSRQTLISKLGSIISGLLKVSTVRISSLSTSTKYLSSFFRYKTSANSLIVESENTSFPIRKALFRASALTEFLIRCALISALVSKTKTKLFVFQNFIQYFLRKTALSHFFP